MSKGMPSLMALLGLVAVAGYQNRDKIGDMIRGANSGDAGPSPQPGSGAGTAPAGEQGGLMGQIGQMFGTGSSSGGGITDGLGELVNRFRTAGHGASADSWVSRESNAPLHPDQLEQALGRDTIDELATKTGLSRDEIVQRLSSTLPQAVDQLTPEGRLPSQA